MEESQGNKKKWEIPEPTRKEIFYKKIASTFVSLGIEDARSKKLMFFILAMIASSAVVSFLLLPPKSFPTSETIIIKKGVSLGEVSLLFKEKQLIRSRFLFETCAKAVGGDKQIIAGSYLFKEVAGSCSLAYRITRGISGIPAAKITIPEGVSNKEIATIIGGKLPGFDTAGFVDKARSQEGYLFPDTYFFMSETTVDQAIEALSQNFNNKISPWKPVIESSKHSLRDIIIMASILEREATTEEDKAMVSGILWNRIRQGMALQVDAPFMYLLGKKSSEITQADLQIKSAYNTYRNKGLPGGPIGNPGISAIKAAIYPTESSYLYYLSDNNGTMHYARTFAEHVANKAKYLK